MAVTQNFVNCACIPTGCQEHIYDLRHVSFSYWPLSQIEASLRLPCSSSISNTPFSSHFSTFRRNILLEHVHHNCQRPVQSVPAPVVQIRSLFNSVSHLFLFFFLNLLFSFWNPLFSLDFMPPSPFLNPSVLGSVTTCRQCLVRQVTSRSSVTGWVMKKYTRQVIEIKMI